MTWIDRLLGRRRAAVPSAPPAPSVELDHDDDVEAERKFSLAMRASELAIAAQQDAEQSLTRAAEKQREAREHLGRVNAFIIGAIKATAAQQGQ